MWPRLAISNSSNVDRSNNPQNRNFVSESNIIDFPLQNRIPFPPKNPPISSYEMDVLISGGWRLGCI